MRSSHRSRWSSQCTCRNRSAPDRRHTARTRRSSCMSKSCHAPSTRPYQRAPLANGTAARAPRHSRAKGAGARSRRSATRAEPLVAPGLTMCSSLRIRRRILHRSRKWSSIPHSIGRRSRHPSVRASEVGPRRWRRRRAWTAGDMPLPIVASRGTVRKCAQRGGEMDAEQDRRRGERAGRRWLDRERGRAERTEAAHVSSPFSAISSSSTATGVGGLPWLLDLRAEQPPLFQAWLEQPPHE